jgi:hypothetical protein
MHEVAVFKRAKTTLAGVIFIKLKPRLTRHGAIEQCHSYLKRLSLTNLKFKIFQIFNI